MAIVEDLAGTSLKDKGEILFDPPLYKQRYRAVSDVINDVQAKSVIDMGCSEGKFLVYVKENCETVEELIGVDIDGDLLKRNVIRLKPTMFEYIIKRRNPLNMSLYCGSIIQADSRFYNLDVLTCIEVIEHLYDHILCQVPENVFGIMKPKVVVITTPNCEYNQFFDDFSGLRHYDHKFEWTRKQFKQWCQRIQENYGYTFELSGVGMSPSNRVDVGYCSQMAVFYSKPLLVTPSPSMSEKEFLSNINNDFVCHHPTVRVCHRSIDKSIVPPCNNNDLIEQSVYCHCEAQKQVLYTASKYTLINKVAQPFESKEDMEKAILDEIGYSILMFYSDTSEQIEEEIEKRVPLDFFRDLPNIIKYDLTHEEFVHIVSKRFTLDKDNLIFKVALPSSTGKYYYENNFSEFGGESSIFDDCATSCDIDYITQIENWDLD